MSSGSQKLFSRYFHHSDARCLCCGIGGHTAESCPESVCKYCNSENHYATACPIQRVCQRCRSKGHKTIDCPAKLKMSIKADGITCSLCDEKYHYEEECPSLWSTFHPDMLKNIPSKPIRPQCYNCASQLHWGDDCSLLKKHNKKLTTIFSSKYTNSLVGPSNQDQNQDQDQNNTQRDDYYSPPGNILNINLTRGFESSKNDYNPPLPDEPLPIFFPSSSSSSTSHQHVNYRP